MSSPFLPLSKYLELSHVRTLADDIRFYCEEHTQIGEKFARFAFCKNPELLHAAGKRLLKLKEYM